MLGEKPDCIAMDTATKAVIELLGRRYGEAGRALVVEGAARGVLAPLPFQRDARADDLDAVVMCYGVKARAITEDPLASMTPGETVMFDPFELEGIGLAGMPI